MCRARARVAGPAAPVARRRALALRRIRLRVDLCGSERATGAGFERAARRLGLDLTVRSPERRSTRALRRRARAHPPRPGRRLARRRRPRRRKRARELTGRG
jgi:hypothetical protein